LTPLWLWVFWLQFFFSPGPGPLYFLFLSDFYVFCSLGGMSPCRVALPPFRSFPFLLDPQGICFFFSLGGHSLHLPVCLPPSCARFLLGFGGGVCGWVFFFLGCVCLVGRFFFVARFCGFSFIFPTPNRLSSARCVQPPLSFAFSRVRVCLMLNYFPPHRVPPPPPALFCSFELFPDGRCHAPQSASLSRLFLGNLPSLFVSGPGCVFPNAVWHVLPKLPGSLKSFLRTWCSDSTFDSPPFLFHPPARLGCRVFFFSRCPPELIFFVR